MDRGRGGWRFGSHFFGHEFIFHEYPLINLGKIHFVFNRFSLARDEGNDQNYRRPLDGAPLRELAKPTRFANLDLVPAKPDLAGTAAELSRRGDGERYLNEALTANGDYSFVFVDCPPSLGPLTVNALAAADRVLVPLQAEYYALEGLAQLVRSVELIRARLNPRLAIAGVILTMVDRRTRLAADVDAEVRRHFGNLVFDASIPRSVRVAEAPSHGMPVTAYDRVSAGADAYWKVAMELVERS